MKKLCCLFLASILFCGIMPVKAEEVANESASFLPNAKSGLLMEASTGKVLYEKNAKEKVAMASLTKMVAQIIILENVEQGKLSWDEKVIASENASGMGGSQIYLATGEAMTVRDLMKGISMASGNDATVAMAERIAGTEAEFVKMMNDKVASLGLTDTVFKNSTGLDEEGHYSTASDLAIIARELLKHDQILEFSGVYEDYLRTNTPNKFWLVNTNKLVRYYEGSDGLKTGHTDNAGYCIAATAKRNGMRLIAIVLGESQSNVRNSETMSLLDYGFATYKVTNLKKKGDIIAEMKIDKGHKQTIKVTPILDVSVLEKKSDQSKNYETELKLQSISLPVKVGDVIGKMLIKENGNVIQEVDITVTENVKPIKFFALIYRVISDIVTGNL